jgi:hypothetical protein
MKRILREKRKVPALVLRKKDTSSPRKLRENHNELQKQLDVLITQMTQAKIMLAGMENGDNDLNINFHQDSTEDIYRPTE